MWYRSMYAFIIPELATPGLMIELAATSVR